MDENNPLPDSDVADDIYVAPDNTVAPEEDTEEE